LSQAGILVGCQADFAKACRRCVSARRAFGPGAWLATRPTLAISTIRSRAAITSHSEQYIRPIVTDFPQTRHTFSGCGAGWACFIAGDPFASRLFPCVKRVAAGLSGLRMVDQNARATHSAYGATARPQVGAVTHKRAANDRSKRQFPSLCSTNHSLLSG
jgi:hypothetical protein